MYPIKVESFGINILIVLILICNIQCSQSLRKTILIKQHSQGAHLQVDGKDFFVKGMNWDYFPIGTNYTFILWNQPETFIKEALDAEMALLKNMGVNTIRVYTGIPPKWISYIYTNFGIYTMLNHTFGRYGLTLDGTWVANTDYSNIKTQDLLLTEMDHLAREYKDTPGLLLFLIGNENNYGLFWDGAETENIPVQDRKSTERARQMYKLFNRAAQTIKAIDKSHPVAICNGDLQFLDIIAIECKDFDIFGTNIYRGLSFGDAFDRVKKEYGKPLLLTEFGADAYDNKQQLEDGITQAKYVKQNWKEIYENAAGIGKAQNCIGGFTFQFSDGWWKHNQTTHLDIHDTTASWSNGGYLNDYAKDRNNMNEEWFGICAKGPTDTKGHYTLYPREAYSILKGVHEFNPLTKGNSLKAIQNHFDSE